jgi:hypothetical protein
MRPGVFERAEKLNRPGATRCTALIIRPCRKVNVNSITLKAQTVPSIQKTNRAYATP